MGKYTQTNDPNEINVLNQALGTCRKLHIYNKNDVLQ